MNEGQAESDFTMFLVQHLDFPSRFSFSIFLLDFPVCLSLHSPLLDSCLLGNREIN
jgi:hypothetical protein